MYRLFLLCLASGQCPPSSILSSSSAATLVERSPGVYSPSALVSPAPSPWTSIPGASWIWETNADTAGEYTFVNTFILADWAKTLVSSLQLTIASDNFYSVTFNGVVVAAQWKGWYSYVDQYELKPWLLGSSAAIGTQLNTLQIEVKNTDGPGGLLYQLTVVY